MYAPPLTPTSEFARAKCAGFFWPFFGWNFVKLPAKFEAASRLCWFVNAADRARERLIIFNETIIKLNFALPGRVIRKPDDK